MKRIAIRVVPALVLLVAGLDRDFFPRRRHPAPADVDDVVTGRQVRVKVLRVGPALVADAGDLRFEGLAGDPRARVR